MRKLKLDVESLTVQTFDTVDDSALTRGTIEGRESVVTTEGPWYCPYACDCDSAPSC